MHSDVPCASVPGISALARQQDSIVSGLFSRQAATIKQQIITRPLFQSAFSMWANKCMVMKRYHGQCRCDRDASKPQSALPLWSGASLTVLQQFLMLMASLIPFIPLFPFWYTLHSPGMERDQQCSFYIRCEQVGRGHHRFFFCDTLGVFFCTLNAWDTAFNSQPLTACQAVGCFQICDEAFQQRELKWLSRQTGVTSKVLIIH